MPTFVNKTNATYVSGGGPYTSGSITHTPTVGNTLLLAVVTEIGNGSVSSVFDDVGNNLFNNPINAWQNLGTITLGTDRLEVWGCLSIVQAPTKVTVNLSNAQNVLVLDLLEYSGVASFGLSGTVSNTGYSSLFFQGTAENNTDIMVAFFVLPQANNMQSGAGTYNIPGQPNFVITPATQRDSIPWAGGGQLLTLEQTVINNPQLLIAQAYLASVG